MHNILWLKFQKTNTFTASYAPRTFLRFESSQTVRNAYPIHYPFSLLITAELDVQVASNLPPGLLTSARRWICMGVLSTRKAVTWMNS
jgi:hypothetical protein